MDYEQFRAQYEQMNRASVPAPPSAAKTGRLMRAGITALFVSAALMSGVHTIPTVRAGIEVTDIITPAIANVVSLAGFVAVEVGMLLAGYGVSKNERVNQTITIAAIIMALGANLASISRTLSSNDLLTIGVALIMGAFAPSMAYVAGLALVGLRDEAKEVSADAWKNYRTLLKEHEGRVNKAWEKYQASARPSAGADSGQLPALVRPQADNADGRHGYGQGYTRTTDAQARAIEWFDANPDEANSKTVRELATLSGIGKTSIADALKIWKQHQPVALVPSTNGNGHGEGQS